ncbi:hypothetical protein SAMN04488061_2254 [Filomicrobium insigne]|uniref:Uncharacterized protein n=1 Tax=Filomicrobium insigne TaxID=418854 RepID=A0A1H0Q4Q9_9HYPH|nr:hypothetical protein [Filomicrobium insigne]SDP12407.1 hypothetical protein SAMN04488061_2254 [Filomicrobium insigne]
MSKSFIESLTGVLLFATAVLVMLSEWHANKLLSWTGDLFAVLTLLLLVAQVHWGRQIFVVVGLALAGIAFATRPDWFQMIVGATGKAAFIAALFTALATMRNAAASSPSIAECGHFLALQPPGRRYIALTVGGQLFGLLLNYGALVLLGTLAEANARQEPNEEIRNHRIRRMLLAIQRGFVSMLTWSPLAFSVAISTSLIPGARWSDALLPCLVSSAILAGVGWGLDTIFKPRLSVQPSPRTAEGSWLSLWPLFLLLAVLGVLVGVLHAATDIRVIGIVMMVVPVISIIWISIQNSGKVPATWARIKTYVTRDLPSYRSEIVLLMMAGWIGTLGGALLSPLAAASGFDLSNVPAWLLLVCIVWLIPLTGQLGMNPIMTVTLLAPLLPSAAAIGVEPSDIIVAITAGWAMSGASSPYTATTLMIGAMGGVSAHHVGLRWNGPYISVCGVALSIWVVVLTLL